LANTLRVAVAVDYALARAVANLCASPELLRTAFATLPPPSLPPPFLMAACGMLYVLPSMTAITKHDAHVDDVFGNSNDETGR